MSSRYSRQELFPGIGKEGQQRLRESCVAIIGCGALGSLQAEVLARAGVGRLILLDRDFVEMSNLQRQSLYTESDARQVLPKAVAAEQHLRLLNSEVAITAHFADFSADSAALIDGAQLLMDGADNFQARYLINDLAWKRGVPWIYGACVGSTGVAAAFVPDASPCFRCVFPVEPAAGSAPTCDTAGILWPAVGAVVSRQTALALRVLTGHAVRPLLHQVDTWEDESRGISLERAKNPACLTCGTREYPSLSHPSLAEVALCGRESVQIRPRTRAGIDLDAMQERWRGLGATFRNPFLLKLQLEAQTIVLFPDGRALIQGTSDTVRARGLYAKYVGA